MQSVLDHVFSVAYYGLTRAAAGWRAAGRERVQNYDRGGDCPGEQHSAKRAVQAGPWAWHFAYDALCNWTLRNIKALR